MVKAHDHIVLIVRMYKKKTKKNTRIFQSNKFIVKIMLQLCYTYAAGQGLLLHDFLDSDGLLCKLQWKSSTGRLLDTCIQLTSGTDHPENRRTNS